MVVQSTFNTGAFRMEMNVVLIGNSETKITRKGFDNSLGSFFADEDNTAKLLT